MNLGLFLNFLTSDFYTLGIKKNEKYLVKIKIIAWLVAIILLICYQSIDRWLKQNIAFSCGYLKYN